jgi:hypothetical protein
MILTIGGFLLFFVIFFFVGPPVKSYILEHELSHVIFAFLSGVGVQQIRVRGTNGFVKTSRINIFIALAPYSLPLYSFILIGIFNILRAFFQFMVLSIFLHLLFGISLSFHTLATIHYVQIEQPDLKRYGHFSSLIFILTWFTVILALLFALVFENIELASYFRESFDHALMLYERVYLLFRKSISIS